MDDGARTAIDHSHKPSAMLTVRQLLTAALVGPAASLIQTADLKHLGNIPRASGATGDGSNV